jgi:hypothetical protein
MLSLVWCGREIIPIILPIRIAGKAPAPTILRKKIRSPLSHLRRDRPDWKRLFAFTIPRSRVATFNHQLRYRTPVVKKDVTVHSGSILIPLVAVKNTSWL